MLKAWINIKELEILGPLDVPRIPIFSFLIKHPESGHYLHHNFICMVLNDLFGIQARGGCMCAGPYGMVCRHHNHSFDIHICAIVLRKVRIYVRMYTSIKCINYVYFLNHL